MLESGILDMNGCMRRLFLVGIGIVLWAVWLRRNDIESCIERGVNR
jgi:hypothetical protein